MDVNLGIPVVDTFCCGIDSLFKPIFFFLKSANIRLEKGEINVGVGVDVDVDVDIRQKLNCDFTF